jgi:hypothetical protein
LNHVYSFNHNLAKVFSEEVYAAQPEVFAKVNGRRKVPGGSGATDPQPDLTHPEAFEVAANAALSHFADKPDSKSFSLSINDNVLFDTTERTEAAVSPLRYFRTRPNYTDLVFGFMNQVAKLVFEEGGAWQTPAGEDRYLTALSYYWAEPAPTIAIHPRVMPVLTSDRAQWHDPDYRAQDKALIQAWAASGAERVATWDYYFGAPHLYPRQFNQWIFESIRHMSKAGIDVFFSQLPSFWGLDGAKLGSQPNCSGIQSKMPTRSSTNITIASSGQHPHQSALFTKLPSAIAMKTKAKRTGLNFIRMSLASRSLPQKF